MRMMRAYPDTEGIRAAVYVYYGLFPLIKISPVTTHPRKQYIYHRNKAIS